MNRLSLGAIPLVAAFFAAPFACSSSQTPPAGPSAGTEQGPCRPDGQCDIGLTCASDICVRGAPTGAATSGSGGSGTGPTTTGATGGGMTSGGTTGTGGTGGSAAGGGAGKMGTGGTSGDPRGPIFLSLSLSPTVIHSDGTPASTTISAVMTDPDGVMDIVGGTLLSADESHNFGAFGEPGVAGTYTFTISYLDMRMAKIVPNFFQMQAITLLVRFFDQAGHVTTRTIDVEVACGDWVCAGACTTTAYDDFNCGGCGRVCVGANSSSSTRICSSSKCRPDYIGLVKAPDSTCDEACKTNGTVCVENGCFPSSTLEVDNGGISTKVYAAPCSADLTSFRIPDAGVVNLRDRDAGSVRCCCTTQF
jgi:hypothetical protein